MRPTERLVIPALSPASNWARPRWLLVASLSPNGGLAPLPGFVDAIVPPTTPTGYTFINGLFIVGGIYDEITGYYGEAVIFGWEQSVAGTTTFDLFAGNAFNDAIPASFINIATESEVDDNTIVTLTGATTRANSNPASVGIATLGVSYWANADGGSTPINLLFPDPTAPTSSTPYLLTAHRADMIMHQNRIIQLNQQITDWASATTIVNANEYFDYTDPPNSLALGTQTETFVQEYPFGHGTWGSISASELFLVKHSGGGYLISGDLNQPTITRLAGVTPTYGLMCRSDSTVLGLVYASANRGLWVWNSSNQSVKISNQLDDNFFDNPQIAASGRIIFHGPTVDVRAWGDWVVVTNDWLLDTNTGGWWKLNPSSTTQPHLYYGVSYDGDLLYASLPNPTIGLAIERYSRVPLDELLLGLLSDPSTARVSGPELLCSGSRRSSTRGRHGGSDDHWSRWGHQHCFACFDAYLRYHRPALDAVDEARRLDRPGRDRNHRFDRSLGQTCSGRLLRGTRLCRAEPRDERLMAQSLASNRLTIPKKNDPSHPANLEEIERWANTQTVNQIVAGSGVTIDTQALSSGTGASGHGIVTINSSGGGTFYALFDWTGRDGHSRKLTQLGGFVVNDTIDEGIFLTTNFSGTSPAIELHATGTGGTIDLIAPACSMVVGFNSGGGGEDFELETTGSTGMFFHTTSSGEISLLCDGTGGIGIANRNGDTTSCGNRQWRGQPRILWVDSDYSTDRDGIARWKCCSRFPADSACQSRPHHQLDLAVEWADHASHSCICQNRSPCSPQRDLARVLDERPAQQLDQPGL